MDRTQRDLEGRLCLVTGGTTGLGLAAATLLAGRGADVIIVGRDPARGEAALAQVRERSGNPRGSLRLTDLSNLADVRRLATEVAGRQLPLRLLINNAATVSRSAKLTRDGVEATFATNYLAPFLLTTLLADRLRQAAPARIINVVSGAEARGDLGDLDELARPQPYSPMKAYARSKRALVLFTYELARRLGGSGVTVNALDPGMVDTRSPHLEGAFKVAARLLGPFIAKPAQAARAYLELAVSPALADVTGRYFDKGKQADPQPADDEVLARRLWAFSEALVDGFEDHVPTVDPATPSPPR